MPTRLEPQARLTLLERDTEVALIADVVDAVRAGAGKVVAIEAGAGMGKTRLLAEARAVAEAQGFRALSARGGEFEQEFSFGVVRQLFEQMLAAATGQERSELVSGAASLSLPLFDASHLADGQAGDPSFAMLHGLYWLAANVAQQQPLALLLDDLHWADPPSLRWTGYMTRRLEGLPLLIVVTSRPPEEGREAELVAEILSDPTAVRVRPRPLGSGAIAALAREAFGIDPESRFVAACETATGGNPLFLSALLDTLARELDAPSDANAGRVTESGPEAVSRFITLRFARLGSEATSVVRAAAVLGEGAELRHVADLACLDVETVAATATTLAKHGLLRHEDPLEFTHPIVRNVVYRGLAAHERTRAHRRAGEILLRSGAPPEHAAAHVALTLPGNDPFVRTSLRAAAERSLAQGAPQAARRYLLRALDESPGDEERAELLRGLGAAELHVDAYDAAEHLAAALKLLRDPVRRAEVALMYFVAVEYLDRFDLGADALERALTELEEGDGELRQLLEAALLECTFWNADWRETRRARIAAVDEEQLGDGRGARAVRAMLALHEAWEGRSRDRAVALAQRALADGISLVTFIPSLSACLTLTLAGELATARRLYDDAEAELRRRGDVVNLLPVLLLRAQTSLHYGDLRAAEEDLRAAELESAQPGTTTAAYRAGFLVETLLERGDPAAAADVLASVRADEQVHAGYRPFYLLARGRFEAEAGRPQRALDELHALAEYMAELELTNPAYVPWRSQTALTLRLLERDDEAHELAAEEVRLARRWGAPRPLGIALRALGLIDHGPERDALLREAVAVLAQSPARLEHARALVDLGAALRRQNARAEAREHLREGLELAHRCGAVALLRRAQEELVAAGARPRRIASHGVDALTPSERRVARMAASGLANKEIAQTLFVTVKAVEVHLSNTYRKLGIGSRVQLAAALDAAGAAPT